ncbi:hypothetical protein NQ318_000700 [Aromia moschata]|uniref:Uncharacterized protein n=1 Tax=Aromia moschata TaxID=1265417 RepID=A0AAV8X1L3_9CUCU|nr:hypothetical protein NQ318_000700 [Aromia moschata]
MNRNPIIIIHVSLEQVITPPSSESDYEKHPETNGISYKYKTNIKLRFTQDINGGGQEISKRQKIENGRRNSGTILAKAPLQAVNYVPESQIAKTHIEGLHQIVHCR